MSTLTRRSFLYRTSVLGLGISALQATPGQAMTVAKSLQMVVPAPAGTQPDLLARWLSEPMARRAGVPVTVINRPGASGAIAVDAVLAAGPETGSLLLAGLDHVAYSHVNNNRRALDPMTDLVPVGVVNRDTWTLVRTADPNQRAFTTMQDLASRKPSINYASTGEGSTGHLLSARLFQALGIEARHIPYRESYLPDVMAGRVDAVLAPTPSVLPQVKAGRLQAVLTLTHERVPQLQDVPSAREAGWPDQVFYGGLFLFAHPALAPQAASLNQWLVEALQEPAIREHYRAAAIEPTPWALSEVRQHVTDRLRTVDAMRMAVFGRAR